MALGPREVEGAEAAVRRVHKLVNGGVAVGDGEEAGAAENGLDEGLAHSWALGHSWTIEFRGEFSALDRGEDLYDIEIDALIVILKVTTRRHVRQPAHFCSDNRRELPVLRMPAEL